MTDKQIDNWNKESNKKRCPLCNHEVEIKTIKVIGQDSNGDAVMGCMECYRLQVEASTSPW